MNLPLSLNSEQLTDSQTASQSEPTTSLAATNQNSDAHEKLSALITCFAERGKSAEGVPAMLMGVLPLMRMQLRKVEPDALNWLAGFLGESFSKIGDASISAAEFETWLSELNQASE